MDSASGEDVQRDRKFLVDVKQTRRTLLCQENTQRDFKITVLDGGPKTIQLQTLFSGGSRTFDLRGTYFLSNLLQELALANFRGWRTIVLREEELTENPAARLSRLIRVYHWGFLTRTVDAKGLRQLALDTKFQKAADRTKRQIARVYVPATDPAAATYFAEFARRNPELRVKNDCASKRYLSSVYQEYQ